VFTRAHHLSLSWTTWIQSITSHLTSLRFIVLSSSHQCPGLPSGHFPSGYPTESTYAFFCPLCTIRPTQLILLDWSQNICGKEYKLHNFLWPTFIFSLSLSSFFSTLFWNILRPGILLNVADQVPHVWHSITRVLYILIFIFLNSQWEDRRICATNLNCS
jgi:hypothetical protein